MAEQEGKVRFNLKNVHYAILEEGEDGSVSYGTPVKVPGAVNITLDAQGDVTPFHADGIVFYNSIANNGYSGDLEMARFPDQMMADIWKIEPNSDNVIIENAFEEPAQFALMFQIDTDKDNELYAFYNCSATRPAIASTTNTETKEPQTQTTSITVSPLENGVVEARTTKNTSAEIKSGWFNAVYMNE